MMKKKFPDFSVGKYYFCTNFCLKEDRGDLIDEKFNKFKFFKKTLVLTYPNYVHIKFDENMVPFILIRNAIYFINNTLRQYLKI